MSERFIESLYKKPDDSFDYSLRPTRLDDFIGQEKIAEQIDVLIKAAQLRGDPLGHCLFSGPPGLGKTTLSYILSEAMGTRIVVTSGPTIERPADLAIELSKLKEGEFCSRYPQKHEDTHFPFYTCWGNHASRSPLVAFSLSLFLHWTIRLL